MCLYFCNYHVFTFSYAKRKIFLSILMSHVIGMYLIKLLNILKSHAKILVSALE